MNKKKSSIEELGVYTDESEFEGKFGIGDDFLGMEEEEAGGSHGIPAESLDAVDDEEEESF